MAQIDFEPTDRWVRAEVGGVTVADSKRVRLLRETDRTPTYYFPVEDVRMDLLEPTGRTGRTGQEYLTLTIGDRAVEDAAWTRGGFVAFSWGKLDHWFEEDDEVYVHARDPYKRVDVLTSSRHVQVTVLGEVVADSRRPRLLFETGLPTRYYLPRQDVRMDLLVPSETQSQCPYKGIASYWSVRVGDTLAKDLAWSYPFPIPECPKIEGLVCFFNEQVDAIQVDGVELERPQNRWTSEPELIMVHDRLGGG